MKFLARIAVLFYVTLVLFVGSFLLLHSLNWIKLELVTSLFYATYIDDNLRLILAGLAGLILFMNFVFYKFFSVNVHRDKIIAFDNPSGRVSVSLAAIEDIIKRMLLKYPEVKEGRSRITASRKGLQIKLRLVLRSEVNIPGLTSKVQEGVKKKVQDTIGVDESVEITIYVGKIMPEKIKDKGPVDDEPPEEDAPPNIPFSGYRA